MEASSPNLLADRYRVLRRLGAGGVATVFLAEDQRLGRRVAVKRLHADSPGDAARRFEREARLGAALNHPNLVSVYDIASDAHGVMVVMEYVAGETLADAMRRGPLLRADALRVLGSVAAALDHAHAHDVVHCDVKPANILLGDDGRVKVVDLGIALAADTSEITGEGTILGTPSYMAPEQLEGGRNFGPAADVYSLAAVAFELLSGRRARRGRSLLEMAHHVANSPPPDVRDAWPQAPPALAAVLRSAMARDPAARPRSAGELVERLEASLRGADTAETPATTEEQPRRATGGRGPVAGAAAGLAAAGAAAGDAAGSPHPARQSTPAGPPTPPSRARDRPVPAPHREPRVDAGAPAPRRQPRRWRGLVAAAAVAAVAVVALVIALGGDEPSPPPAAEAPPSGEGAPGAGATEAADETVTSFYEAAAEGDYDSALELATPTFERQLGGAAAFADSQSTLQSIEFERAEVTSESEDSAEVAIETVATHTDGVDQCEGTLSLVPDGGAGWLIDQASIDCPQSTRPG